MHFLKITNDQSEDFINEVHKIIKTKNYFSKTCNKHNFFHNSNALH